jgi:hypothetical protein
LFSQARTEGCCDAARRDARLIAGGVDCDEHASRRIWSIVGLCDSGRTKQG